MKRIYAILCAALAVSMVGCANDSDSVVSQAAAAAIQRNSSASNVETAASVAGKISGLNTAGTHAIKVPASAVTSVNDIYTIKNAVHAKNAEDSSIKVSLDFSDCTFPNNTAISGLFLNYDNSTYTTLPGPGLVGVIFPKNLEVIEGWILQDTGVTSITVPASVKYVNGYAFFSMASLTSLTFESAIATQPTTWFTGAGNPIEFLRGNYSSVDLTVAGTNANNFKNSYTAVFTQAYISEQKANAQKQLASTPSVNVENSTSTDVSKYQNVTFTATDQYFLFKVSTTASATYNFEFCSINTGTANSSRQNVPAVLIDTDDVYIYDENMYYIKTIGYTSATDSFTAAGTTTYIYIKKWNSSDVGTCAFRISK